MLASPSTQTRLLFSISALSISTLSIALIHHLNSQVPETTTKNSNRSPLYSALEAHPRPNTPAIKTAIGDTNALMNQYHVWKQKRTDENSRFQMDISLVSGNTHTKATIGGRVHINLEKATIIASLITDTSTPLSLWANQNNQRMHMGTFHEPVKNKNGTFQHRLQLDISKWVAHSFKIGQFEVMPQNNTHPDSLIAAGSPSLFQRFYATEIAQAQKINSDHASSKLSLANLLVPIATADEATGFPNVFNDLITQGEDLFFNETFSGNGRSCGTCHPATNNFTIDKPFIQSLPDTDPLFAAEFLPALTFGEPENLDENGQPQRFENPALMREFGLIVENTDGMGDLGNRFTMRSVPHNIGMSVSVTTPPNGLTPPNDRTGWSGDGAPSGIVGGIAASGRVRDFMLGAIVQHYPKTLKRSFTGPNPDFRPPTTQELDAIEAFLFSIGRQQELNLDAGASNELVLKDQNAEAGKALFRDGVSGGNRTCNGCHSNAGANVARGNNPGNRNFNTGVELFLQNRLSDPNFHIPGEPRPVDGGFGINPDGTFTSLTPQPGFNNENFGNQRFNTTSLVEAADTPPFFHNNSALTLEDSIAFYNSPEFLSEGGGNIPFSSNQIDQVADFLRVINAIDNIEHSVLRQIARYQSALEHTPIPNTILGRMTSIIVADAHDTVNVLNQGDLHNSGGAPVNAVKKLEQGIQQINQADQKNKSVNARRTHINTAKIRFQEAISIMKF